MSPFCLSCGAPLGSQTPTFAGKPASGGSALPWILGGIALLVLLALGVVVAGVVIAASHVEPEPAPPSATPVLPPPIETARVADAAPDAPAAKVVPTVRTTPPQLTPPPTIRPPPTLAATPFPPPPPTSDVATEPFPRARAQAEVDRVSQALTSCKQSTGPFGTGTIRVEFEPDGRIGTLTRPPFAGTAVGNCISARFRAIRIGRFLGSTTPIEKAFIIQE